MDWERNFKARTITATEWEDYRELFERLYVFEDNSLAQVRKILATKYGFYANEAQYKKKITKWGFEKTLTKKKKAMLRMRDIGANKGKNANSTCNGPPASDENLILSPRICELKGEEDSPLYTPSSVEYETLGSCSPVSDHGTGDGGATAKDMEFDIPQTIVVNKEAAILCSDNHRDRLNTTFSPTVADISFRALVDNLQQFEQHDPHFVIPNLQLSGIHISNDDGFDQTLKLLEQTLTKCENVFGVDHYFTLEVASGIAAALHCHGMHENALQFYTRAWDRYEKVLGGEHPTTLSISNDMARIFFSQEQYEDALKWYQQTLNGRKRQLGADHPSTLDTMHSMAMVYDMQGRYAEALKWYNLAFEGKVKVLGEGNLSTLSTINNIAMILLVQEFREDPLLERILAGINKLLREDPPSILSAIKSITLEQRCHEEVIQFYKLALSSSQKDLGEDHHLTLQTVMIMAVVFERQGRYTKAIGCYRQALAGWKKTGGGVQNTIGWMEMRVGILRKKLAAKDALAARYSEGMDNDSRLKQDEGFF